MAGNVPYYGAGDAELFGVSCGSSDRCIAVGVSTYATAGGHYPSEITEEWVGSGWRPIAEDPALSSADKVLPHAVSCWAAYGCLAVGGTGRYQAPNDGVPDAWTFGETGRWGAAMVPPPVGGAGGIFLGVACPAPNECVAVGDTGQNRKGATERALAGQWDGTSWRLTIIS
jgi:hypothetical protein